METSFKALKSATGMGHEEIAEFLAVRLDTVKAWSRGRRGCPETVIEQMKTLYRQLEAAAGHQAAMIRELTTERPGAAIEIGIASDDHEARSLGLPGVGAHRTMIGMIIARLDVPVRVVPRGSTVATAAAIEAHQTIGRG